jgi:hypothetical protein
MRIMRKQHAIIIQNGAIHILLATLKGGWGLRMRTNEDMMPILSICHGHGSKMNFSVSDYIRGDTAYLTLHHLWKQPILKLNLQGS